MHRICTKCHALIGKRKAQSDPDDAPAPKRKPLTLQVLLEGLQPKRSAGSPERELRKSGQSILRAKG